MATINQAPQLPLIHTNHNGITELMLNDPSKYNTLSAEVLGYLLKTLGDIAADPKIRVVVIAARGKAFCSGHNLKQMRANHGQEYYEKLLADCASVMQSIVALPQPVIAKVQGLATAAGCQLVASCDLAIASKTARFATNGINNGLFCATPAVAIGRTIARKQALEMLLMGEFIDADRAAAIGLINYAVEEPDLDNAVEKMALELSRKSQYALRLGKASFQRQIEQPLDAAYRSATNDLVCNLLSDDGIEGADAFIEKRRPHWNNK
ncbi:MAG TPA: enoyl-CoA hydratase [Gammaproteobacteria bacterium]|nr:enoyl-CoA hydratase [Gammaproteobacteria bacterium]